MVKFRPMLIAAAMAAAVLAAPAARAATDQQQLVDRSLLTVQDMMKDKEFGTAPDLIKKARAVLIVPRIFKAGFFFGGSGGQGVLLARSAAGGWSSPAFYTIGSASFGLQIGAQESEMVLFIMTPRALQSLLRNEFKVGASAGLAIVTLGSSAEAATAGNLNADIIAWASSTGAFAGITLEGSVIRPSASYDHAYYGHNVTTGAIVLHNGASNAGADPLKQALSSAG